MLRNYRDRPLTEEEMFEILDQSSDAEFCSSDKDDEIDAIHNNIRAVLDDDDDDIEQRNEDDTCKPASSATIFRAQSTPDLGGIIDEPSTSRLQCKGFTASCSTLEQNSLPCTPKRTLRNLSCSPRNFTLRSGVSSAVSEENETVQPDMPLNAVSPTAVNVSPSLVDVSHGSKFVPTPKEKIKWKPGFSFESPPVDWSEPSPPELVSLLEPIEYFQRYITPEIVEVMAQMTNTYVIQNNVKFAPTSAQEVEVFLGISILMGNLKYPRVRLYWDSKLGIDVVSRAMPVNRFQKIRRNLHVVNSEEKPEGCTDRFWKVRPLYTAIRKRCYELPLPKNMSVDEQIIPFKGQINVKQYNPNKPCKWGVKNYVLCSSEGLMLDFLLYQGSTTEVNDNYKQYGSGAGVVMKLSERITTPNHLLVFDNFFSSYALFQWLTSEKGIYGLGTVRLNRFADPPLLPEKQFKKLPRGSSEEIISKDGVVLTQWLDNKRVVLGSTYVGIGTKDNCKRWDRKTKTEIKVPRPEAVTLYNNFMGGVDKLDFLVTIYRTFIRSCKWTMRLITHAIDLALTNSWLEYRKDAEALGIPKKKQLDLIHFRYEVAESLMYANKVSSAKSRVGRPSKKKKSEMVDDDMDNEYVTPVFPLSGRSVRQKEVKPVSAVRLDEFNHFPAFDVISKYPQRCKATNCFKKTFFMCTKCNVHICITRERNCFVDFHEQ